MDNKKIKLPQHLQLDSVSPATRLLEKRRLMYEVQEAFEQQKEEFKKKEDQFKRRENELRQRDLEIQENLIRFSKYLQDNEAKKMRAEKRAQEEKKAIGQKQEEIEKKQNELLELQEKSSRLDRKVQAMKKFESYLESVRDYNHDEYAELTDILTRHRTLDEANKNLINYQQKIEKELEDLRNTSTKYEKEKNAEILALNNKIADLQKKLEDIADRKNKLQSQVEATTSDARNKTSELGQILMSIDNLYTRCRIQRPNLKHKIDDESIKNFDNFTKRGEISKQQLNIIESYLKDFKKIVEECQKRTGVKPEITH